MSERVIEGVSADVAAKMIACDANIVDNNGLLLRTCEHGIRHPVGHLHRALRIEGDYSDRATAHSRAGEQIPCMTNSATCDGCCDAWRAPTGSAV